MAAPNRRGTRKGASSPTKGRPKPVYDWPVVQAAFLDHIIAGGTWAEFAAQDGHPSEDALARRLASDAAFRTAYRETYDAASDIRFERFEAKARAVADYTDKVKIMAARVSLDMERWALSKRSHRFSDKVDVTSNGQELTTFTLGIGTA